MRKVQICLELDDENYVAFEHEARREGTTVEAVVEKVVRGLYRELREEEAEGDHPIVFP